MPPQFIVKRQSGTKVPDPETIARGNQLSNLGIFNIKESIKNWLEQRLLFIKPALIPNVISWTQTLLKHYEKQKQTLINPFLRLLKLGVLERKFYYKRRTSPILGKILCLRNLNAIENTSSTYYSQRTNLRNQESVKKTLRPQTFIEYRFGL